MAPPALLYKYRSLDPGCRDRTLRAITHGEVWFSSLREFNDPFEARVSVSLEGDDDVWRREFGVPRPNDDKLRALVPELEGGVREDAEKFGMFCLSAIPDHPLMWSHYASSHKGACLGFRTTGDSFIWDAQAVEYSDHYPLIDYFRMNREERVRAMLLRKARHWEYEREWRAFRTGPKPGMARLRESMLASVILGCRINAGDRQELLTAVTRFPGEVEVFQARRGSASYSLEMERLDVSRTASR
jgi:hypothetical protein